MPDFKKFLLDNNIINLRTYRKNSNKTGNNTSFYKQHSETFEALFDKHGTRNLLEAILLEFEKIEYKKCLNCGMKTSFSDRQKDYLQCCSKQCQSRVSNGKRMSTCLKEYGEIHPMKNTEIKNKQKNTNEERYNVSNVFQSDDVKKKLKETNLNRYGVEYYAQCPDFVEKIKKTNNDLYGVNFPAQSKKIRDKIDRTLIEKYGSNTHQPIQNYQDLNVEFILDNLLDEDGRLEIAKVLDHFQCSRDFWVTKIKPLVAGKVLIKKATGLEQNKIADFIKFNYSGSVLQDDRSVLNGLELDIYLPEKNFAIEYNGTYWHSFGKGDVIDKYKHLRKTKMCEDLGIHLFHVWEYDWNSKKEIVKSMISNKLDCNKKIYARKCEIREVGAPEANSFCDINHLQGKTRSSIRYGLFHESTLVSLMTFGLPRYNKNADWELIRSCSLLNHTIVGGFQKLLNQFVENHTGSIITYANRNYSYGNVYQKSGFDELEASPPSQRYWKPNTNNILTRNQCQKHKLGNLLEDYDPNDTEMVNMLDNGYRVMWDCGNKVFTYNNKKKGNIAHV